MVADYYEVDVKTNRDQSLFVLRVIFSPERTHDSAGNRVKQFLQGAKCEELPQNTVEKEKEGE